MLLPNWVIYVHRQESVLKHCEVALKVFTVFGSTTNGGSFFVGRVVKPMTLKLLITTET